MTQFHTSTGRKQFPPRGGIKGGVKHFTILLILFLGPITASAESTSDKILPISGQQFTVADRPAFLIMPDNVTEGKPTPWIFYAPTFNSLPGPEEKWMIKKFLAAGIAIAGVDVGESYGNPEGSWAYTALYNELIQNRNMAPKAALLARSRGGLMLYNWASDHPEKVVCIAGIMPVCDLRSYPGLDKAAEAYGLTPNQLERQLPAHNPVDQLAPLANADIPIFHIHGDSDTVVPLKENSGELAKRYKKLGGSITLEIVKGKGHDMWTGWFKSQALVDFIIANVNH